MRTYFVTIASLVLISCGAGSNGGKPHKDGGIAGNPGEGDNPLLFDGGMGMNNSDANCGAMQFSLDRVQPNLFLVLDRSGSMTEPEDILTLNFTAKWDDLKTTMQWLTTTYDSKVRFGLSLFSDPASSDSCAAGSVVFACGAGNGSQVMAKINATSPNGSTPTAPSLDTVIAGGGLDDVTRGNYVVLVTDGEPNCSDTDVTARIKKLYGATPSVRTFIIGEGAALSSNAGLLNEWAVAGHTDLPGATKYFQSSSQSNLQTAFDTIAGSISSCTFHMGTKAPDANQLYVWEDQTAIAADPTNGYTYDASGPSITLHGTACDTIKGDANKKVAVIYGCPAPPIN